MYSLYDSIIVNFPSLPEYWKLKRSRLKEGPLKSNSELKENLHDQKTIWLAWTVDFIIEDRSSSEKLHFLLLWC